MTPYALTAGSARATVVPARGGIVSRFAVGGREVLFLDPATLADETKNVRGGIPVLFPFPGKPPAGSPLKQHGFARNSTWAVVEASPTQLLCALESSDATLAAFAFAFRIQLTVTLTERALRLGFDIENRSEQPMPLHFGLHPYFAVPLAEKKGARIETDATSAFDNRTGKTGHLPPIDFGGEEVDLHLLDHSKPGTAFNADVRLDWSPNFHTLVLWTLPNQPFICVEPWSAPALTLGSRTLAPGATELFFFQVSVS